MNANIDGTTSAGLSLQPQAVICPKCQYKRTAADQCPQWQCPGCGVAYSKAAAPSSAVVLKVNTVRGPARQEIDRDELETVTPSALSVFIDGRIGRLRYLAYSWPMMVLSGLAILAAIVPKTPALVKSREILLIPLALLFILWIWTLLRLMALRLHDVNRSAKWVLALLLLPAVGSVVGGPQWVPICSSVFWVVSLLLIIWPGSEGYNDYGPPAGPNTTLVKVGAGVVLTLMALGVIGNVKYLQYVRDSKLGASASRSQGGVAEEQPEPGSVQTPKEKALAALRQSVDEISPTLPKKIDRVTTLTGVEVRGDTYKVYYSMDPSVNLDTSRKDAAEQLAKQKICQGATRTLIDNGITVEYHYTFSASSGEQTMFVFVPPGSCS